MKKLISVAAFLAASSALATAATLVSSFDSFTGEGQTDSQGLLSINASSTDNITYSDGVAAFSAGGSAVMFISNPSSSSLFSGASAANGLTITMTISGLSLSGSSTINSIASTHGASYNWGIGVAQTDDLSTATLQGTWSSAVYSSGSPTTTSVDLSDTFVLTLVYGGASGTQAYIDGTLVYSNSSLKSTGTTTYFTQINVGALSTGANGVNMNLHNLYVHSGAMTADEIVAFNASIIPEPSAFGLLAGVGALALVAARRRRRAK